jgi:hypothetical protein
MNKTVFGTLQKRKDRNKWYLLTDRGATYFISDYEPLLVLVTSGDIGKNFKGQVTETPTGLYNGFVNNSTLERA